MSQNLPNMLNDTISKIREMVDTNNVIGEPIVVGDVTIIPVSKVSVGFGGGGSDHTKAPAAKDMPFGGGVGGGVKVTPICFLIVGKEGNVRMMPVAAPANTTADRIVEMVPDTLDKISAFIDSHSNKTV
ncbi:MAG: sporulation protein YtfJ [Oscillospiraceae bacterium]|nr:sporulation protein YtfJ [Oscillospiraceae bacterium]